MTQLSDLWEPTRNHGASASHTASRDRSPGGSPTLRSAGDLVRISSVPDGRLGSRPRWGPTRAGNQATGLPLQDPEVGKEHGNHTGQGRQQRPAQEAGAT